MEQSSISVVGSELTLGLSNYVSGYDVAMFEFQLRYSKSTPESVTLKTIELCHNVSPTEPSATVGPVTGPLNIYYTKINHNLN